MSSLPELLAAVAAAKIRLSADGETLRVSAPPGALTPELRAQIQQRKPELLGLLRRASGSAPVDVIERVDRSSGDLPLSLAQERLWLVDQMQGKSAAYNVPAAFRVSGALDAFALDRSLREILSRHEALRTSFRLKGSRPVQVIAAAPPFALAVVDLRQSPPGQQASEVDRLTRADAQRPFDLAKSPLFRATLLRLAPEEHVLLLNVHHIVCDGWSLGVIFQELADLYTAFRAGQPSPLPPVPLQYADFAQWQRNRLSGDALEREAAYWRERLAGAPPLLDILPARSRPSVLPTEARTHRFLVPAELTEALRALARDSRTTLYMTVLGAFAILLRRWSGHADVLTATPVANRSRVEFEKVVGFFVNTVILRVRVEDGQTLRQYLESVREVTISAQSHPDLSLPMLTEILQPERSASYAPLVQVDFVLLNAPPMPKLEFGGLVLSPIDFESEVAKFDLNLIFHAAEEGLRGLWEYNTSLIDEAAIVRLTDDLVRLLTGMAHGGLDQAVAGLR